MQQRRRLLAVFSALALLGCAQAPSVQLSPNTAPVRGVRLYVWAPGDPLVSSSAQAVLLSTLRDNGLPVRDLVALDQPLRELQALERVWSRATDPSDASHALVVTQQHLDSFGAATYVRYEAVLWDSTSRRLVWKSSLASLSNLAGDTAPLRAKKLAGDILRGLAQAHDMTLPGGVPRDASGEEIPPTLIPLQVR